MNRCTLTFIVLFTAAAAAAHAQARAGGEFGLTVSTSSGQSYPSVAVGPRGDMIVVWDEAGRDGSGLGIFGRRFDATGAPRGAEFRVNSTTSGDQQRPSVAADPRGGFVVAWTDFAFQNFGVMAQRFDALGAPLGGEFRVGTGDVAISDTPTMAFDAAGNFVVAWLSPDSSGDGDDVLARRYDASGAPLDGGFRVNGANEANRFGPFVARARSGAFIVVWSSHGKSGDSFDVFGKRFDGAGTPLGGEFRLSSQPPGFAVDPAVAVAADGSFVAAWLGYGIVARRFDAEGRPGGADFAVSAATTEQAMDPVVATDADGDFTVVWDVRRGADVDVMAARFDAAGQKRGSDFRVNTTAADRQYLNRYAPPVASDPAGNVTVVWTTVDVGAAPTGLFGQRFGGLLPVTDVVDTAGNGVWEPGETVDLRPLWRNANGAAQSFTGTLTRLTGPGGATYTITAGSAAYGTVPNGATGACIDCYGVAVSAPSARPATHWDAVAVEKLAPDAQGQVERWPLHIGASFPDVPSTSPFYRSVETLLHRGVTAGCTDTTYCPGGAVTREQMAVFVLAAREGPAFLPPACGTPLFADVPAGSPFCRWIEELARRGVATGCGQGAFCPGAPVTREQMAVFLLHTLDPALSPPPCAPPNVFADVPEISPFCRWIEELARRGISGGCGGGFYCPQAAVTREQMAAFVTTTFGLTLYGL